MSGFTPLMEAAASGHEIIVQYLLDRVSVAVRLLHAGVFHTDYVIKHVFSTIYLQKVKVGERNSKGETARGLAMMYGYIKIVGLIDSRSQRIKPGVYCLLLS